MSDPECPSYRQITLHVDGAVAVLRLNRALYRNAQSRVLREELDAAFDSCARDDAVRVVVLFGAGDHFSAGHDLGTPDEEEDRRGRPVPTDYRGRYEWMRSLNVANTLRWRDFPKPTIAAVQGYCIFAGCLLAAAMDVVIAADDALFLPEYVQYFTMPWDVGARKAKEILFEGRFVRADEALQIGMINQVVPRDELEERALDLAQRFAQNDPYRLEMTKRAVNDVVDAQGFRTSIETSFLRFFHIHEAEREAGGGAVRAPGSRGPRRPRVERAFRRLRESAGHVDRER